LDGPVAPLVKSENRWRPKKDANALVVAEKQVKAILNKMTKEKFDKLSTQMCEIPILSYDMLTMMIHNVYEKAIDEPSFGDMYADLCAKLSLMASQQGTTTFIQIIPSDEEPPTDGEAATGESSSYKVYRWSNDVSTTDAEIVGPYASADECTEVALSGEDVEPTQRPDDLKLELVSLNIAKGTFIKVMKKKDEDNVYYVVYFPVAEHDDCGQQLSKIFLSERECMSDAVKQNSFKRSLLNKCQDEFDKQDIYVGWKEEKKAYEESKSSMTEAERNAKEEELDFRRIRIKKQMLGNIKFIGQLFKKGLLKEKIMRYCIGSLLKLEAIDDAAKYPEYRDTGDMDLDEEDHEAACSMFATIGKTIDKPHAKAFMHVCFSKMEKLSNDKSLNSRSRFMYKDLIDMRKNRWEPRRQTEKAKTIDEIRKDFEREERRQEQQSRMGGGGHRGGNRGDRRDFNDRRDSRRDFGRSRQPKPQQTDDDGFTTVSKGAGKRMPAAPISIAKRPQSVKAAPAPKSPSKQAPRRAEPEPVKKDGPAPLDPKKLERRIATIRNEYMQDPANVEELLLSFDELTGTPDYGKNLVSVNCERVIDAKDAERNAIIDMLVLLVEKDRLSKEHVRTGLANFVEEVDMMVMDLPKVYEYVADMLSALLKAEALDVVWLCERAQKIKDDDMNAPGAHEKLIRKTMEAMKSKYGADAVQSSFADNDSSLKLASLLGADKWNEMASEILA
jgi:translation initiation factor 4G